MYHPFLKKKNGSCILCTYVCNPFGLYPAEYGLPPALANTEANKPTALEQWLLTA